MFRIHRSSLPDNLCTNKNVLSNKRASVDLDQKELLVNGRLRLGKLNSIIKSKVNYNASLKSLKNTWSRSRVGISFQPPTPCKTNEPIQQQSFTLKVHKLQHYMKTTLIIFNQLFAHTKSKKDIVKRLHGWQDQFEDFFFDDSNLVIKRINMSEMIVRFGFDKRTSRSTSYYNKLKLLIEEVNLANEERYNLLSEIQMSKITQKLQVIQQINQQFKRSYHGKDKSKYENMAKVTIDRISDIKSKMWNTSRSVKYIEDLTGPIEINHFLRKQENKLCYVENIFLKTQKD